MIATMLRKSRHAAVALSGGMDSLVVLQQVRELAPDTEVLVFRTDWTPQQWGIIDNLIKLWDLTVVTPPPQASYFVPNGDQLARVDEYDVGGAVLPVLRDVVHDDARCVLELERNFLAVSPLDYDCVFTGTRRSDSSAATGPPLRRAISRVGELWFVAPIFYWTDEQVKKAAKDLPYAKEWYEEKDERFDTGNLLACGACVRRGDGEPVHCPKEGKTIAGHVWDQPVMLEKFRSKFGFGGTTC
jgi:3'-phosphoadenosine 5'-phosphosulfate sulfotransferase (PAPS reductase)/FAD synthetase